MTRSSAALLHLCFSLLLLAACAGLVMFAWYPGPFLQLPRSGELAAALTAAACIIMPALTWLVFTPGKSRPKLILDLVVIGLIQLSAVTWGMYNLSAQKPYFMVFTLDRFDVMSRRQVFGSIDDPAFLDKPFSGPAILYAVMPAADSNDYQRLLQEVMFEGKPDIQYRPEFWSVYSERAREVLRASRPLADLRAARPDAAGPISALVVDRGGDITQLKFVPGMIGRGHFAAVLDGASGDVVGYINTDPWLK
jgi:hypothetical protein